MVLTTLLAASAMGSPALVQTKITAASLFKNGYAVVVREAPFTGGEVLIEDPPLATLGTLWVTANGNVKLSSVVATTTVTETTTDLNSLDALITANVGKRLTVLAMLPGKSEPESLVSTVRAATGSLLVLDMEDGSRLALQKASVVRILSTSGDMIYQAKGETRKRVLRVRGTGTGNVVVLSLERGLTWAPGYHVDITNETELTVTSKATVINDLGKIESIDLKLITGFPHVRFINILDPLTSGMQLDQFLNSMMQTGAAVADAAPMAQNSVFAGGRPGTFGEGAFTPFDPSQLEGMQLEDLFFYTLPNVTLDKGERGYYVQFQEKAKYEHVYTLDLPETGWWQNANEAFSTPDQTKYEVWHTLEFLNPSAFPLTTAAATTFKNGQIIGQDMLSYTAPKSKAVLRITKALDIQPDVVEQELDRQIAAIPRTSYTRAYDLVTAKGTIQVANYKSEAVKVKVMKMLVGEVTAASHNGAITKNRVGLRSVNPNSEIRWTLDLKAGEKVDLTYDFKVYVPTP